ncbi:nuclear localized protein [Perilla frutescens var. hirtella]|uniref:Nuclear localized protein n=1 Tax=Perilla frutescens var. hirtella TaxID=608512 RepID=A0AAD4J2K6_PERFH|nr:nuclear localized protein [Perilla frutescens var. hirtella]
MEMEPWEALDLDDSDLPSLLRPCKQRRSKSPATTTAAAENSLSQPPPSQPPLENHAQQLQQPLPPSSSGRVAIPGPAGAVHAAMLRKNLDYENNNYSNHQTGNDGVLSTQEYIRKAMDDTAEFDDDFSRHPWLSALQFLGAEDGLIPTTPINSIKKCCNGDKVVQVVAVVKSCTPNGLGGLSVSLKDPTGTIGATIHHKVLSQSEFGKELTIGAVLILQEVAIFAPVKSAHYLNVTLRNVAKVFCQSKDSASKLYKSAYPVQYADPGSCQKAQAVEKISSVQNVMCDDTERTQSTRTVNSRNSVIQRLNISTGSTQSNKRDSTNTTVAKRGYNNLSQHAGNEGPEDTIRTRIIGNDQEFVNGTNRGAKGGNLEGNLLKDTDNMTNSLAETTGEIARGTNEVQTQRQPLMSKTTPPEWTDEQLDELFVGDEDDLSLVR